MDLITLELLSDSNIEDVRKIQRDDISEAFVDTADTIIELNQCGIDHNCKGHTYSDFSEYAEVEEKQDD